MLRFAYFPLCLVWAFMLVSGCAGDEETIEVLPRDAFVVLLSEAAPIRVGPLSDRLILAGHQYFLVEHLDSDGQKVQGHGLAEFTLSPGLQSCDDGLGPAELHCLLIEEAGSHVLEVSVGDKHLVLPFEAVLESEIIEIEVLQPDEEELLPGTWVHVDVVGVTEDGTHVSAIHPRFEVGDDSYFGYFAYQYDPNGPSQTLDIEALDRSTRTKFRGTPR